MKQFLWLITPVWFLAVWCFVILMISFISGWSKLAKKFQAAEKYQGRTFYFQRVRLNNGCNYSGCLTLQLTAQGLYMNLWPIFRIGHPPLIIPWHNFSAFTTEKHFWLTYYATTVVVEGAHKVSLAFCDKETATTLQTYIQDASFEKTPTAFSLLK
jgi:hypothetical protein